MRLSREWVITSEVLFQSMAKQVQMPNLRLGPEDSAARVEISTRCVDIRTLPWP